MHADWLVVPPVLLGFLLVLTRVAGAFVFVPIPGAQDSAAPVRVVLALAISFALFPQWPAVSTTDALTGRILVWLLKEAAVGITIGLAVSFVAEALQLMSQVFGLQAGYTFASTIDPTTQADTNILQVFARLTAGLLFFSLNLHHEVLRAFVGSMQTHPPGTFDLNPGMADAVIRLGAGIFTTAVRLALPVVAMLMMVDLALALMGRINAQLQLLTLAFPLKMLATIVLLSWLLVIVPRVYRGYLVDVLGMVRRLTGL